MQERNLFRRAQRDKLVAIVVRLSWLSGINVIAPCAKAEPGHEFGAVTSDRLAHPRECPAHHAQNTTQRATQSRRRTRDEPHAEPVNLMLLHRRQACSSMTWRQQAGVG